MASILPHGGVISYGDAKLEVQVQKELSEAEASVDDVAQASPAQNADQADQVIDDETEPYDLVMDTWYDLSDAITQLAVEHGGEDDRRQVWTNLERLCDRGVINEAQKGAVRDLQKARNSIRRLQDVDRQTANNFAETARRLTAAYEAVLSD